MPLTDTIARQVKHKGAEIGERYADGGGMYLRVKAPGKYWRMDYRFIVHLSGVGWRCQGCEGFLRNDSNGLHQGMIAPGSTAAWSNGSETSPCGGTGTSACIRIPEVSRAPWSCSIRLLRNLTRMKAAIVTADFR
ncbi:Arm DNA-binding domain-containing protein [Variovorax paradoxus]|uniref:Arm DNA-binding domain-containing protein n=1 Tax=Variovorax paradoxus TaxID=34073 RepID=UPI00359021A7